LEIIQPTAVIADNGLAREIPALHELQMERIAASGTGDVMNDRLAHFWSLRGGTKPAADDTVD
jgi:hypothetical protein